MFIRAPRQIAGDANIENAVALVGDDVNEAAHESILSQFTRQLKQGVDGRDKPGHDEKHDGEKYDVPFSQIARGEGGTIHAAMIIARYAYRFLLFHSTDTAFRPTMPATISAMHASRSVLADSPNSTMPRMTVPIVPMPVQIA